MTGTIVKAATAIVAGIGIAFCPTPGHSHKCHPHKHHYCVNPGGPIIKPSPSVNPGGTNIPVPPNQH